ncbi:MAG: dTDP-4-dehydrorhamnose 3,5-epimerase family protein [Leptospiraceae bacterium]|nr:dTDP-4-dehydrorhamnose 3,5-epimerase family protein [Leptospiraceae bacterium]
MFSINKEFIDNVFTFKSNLIEDNRGWFNRLYCSEELNSIGIKDPIQQINHSYTKEKGTIRGMHFQEPPYSEVKILRCLKGSIFDVIIDLRKGSKTFLQSFKVKLSEDSYSSIVIPKGFAHGFQALEDNVEMIYFHTELYSKESEGGILYNDPFLNISWPLPVVNVSERDLSFKNITPEFKGLKIEM